MIREAIEYVVGLGQVKTIKVNDQEYSIERLNHIKQPSPAELNLTTLTGLVEYVKSSVDKDFHDGELIIHVVNPNEVNVYSPLHNDAGRHTYVSCKPILPKITFNNFIGLEEMNVMLQSCFVPAVGSVSEVLKVIGNVKEENVQTIGDDGVSQQVVAKTGIATVSNVVVPNPVKLAPYRSFPEIEQVSTDFVLRMQSGGRVALFEADGGMWRVEAASKVADYMKTTLITQVLDGKVKIIA